LALINALIEKYKWKKIEIKEAKADIVWLFPLQ